MTQPYTSIPKEFLEKPWPEQDFFERQLQAVADLYVDAVTNGYRIYNMQAVEEASPTIKHLFETGNLKQNFINELRKSISLLRDKGHDDPLLTRRYGVSSWMQGPYNYFGIFSPTGYDNSQFIKNVAHQTGVNENVLLSGLTFNLDNCGRIFFGVRGAELQRQDNIEGLPQYEWFQRPKASLELFPLLTGTWIDGACVLVEAKVSAEQQKTILESVTEDHVREILSGRDGIINFGRISYDFGEDNAGTAIIRVIASEDFVPRLVNSWPPQQQGETFRAYILHNRSLERDYIDVADRNCLYDEGCSRLPVPLRPNSVTFKGEPLGKALIGGNPIHFDNYVVLDANGRPVHSPETVLTSSVIREIARDYYARTPAAPEIPGPALEGLRPER